MGIFDTHAHYHDARFCDDLAPLLASMPFPNEVDPLGVDGILECACDLDSSRFADALSREYPFVYAAVGCHPSDAARFEDAWLDELVSLAGSNPKIVAIGECGLEYHYDFVPRAVQKEVLDKLFCLSERLFLPIVIHDREAHGDTMDMIRAHKNAFGILHSFSGSHEMVKELVRRGWYISFGGSVTFKNAENVRRSAAAVPTDRLLAETDCPYLAPVPYRGRRNDSHYCYHTLAVLAQIKGVPVEEMAKITKDNALRLFKIYENDS